jgi:hypothetical protein
MKTIRIGACAVVVLASILAVGAPAHAAAGTTSSTIYNQADAVVKEVVLTWDGTGCQVIDVDVEFGHMMLFNGTDSAIDVYDSTGFEGTVAAGGVRHFFFDFSATLCPLA